MAVFLDLENIAIGARDARYPTFSIAKVFERLFLKGHIVLKKAYCDFSRFKEFKRDLHDAAFELIEIPHFRQSGKNSADIRMVVDALDIAFSKEHIDTFVLVSGDSDFSPLVSKLRENDKTVIGIGIKAASAQLLIENCDEFIYYEDLVRQTERARKETSQAKISGKKKEAYDLVRGAIRALFRDGKELVWASMVKQTIKRKKPSFDESYHDFNSFSDLLLQMEKDNLVTLEKDERSGSLIVTALAGRRSR